MQVTETFSPSQEQLGIRRALALVERKLRPRETTLTKAGNFEAADKGLLDEIVTLYRLRDLVYNRIESASN